MDQYLSYQHSYCIYCSKSKDLLCFCCKQATYHFHLVVTVGFFTEFFEFEVFKTIKTAKSLESLDLLGWIVGPSVIWMF